MDFNDINQDAFYSKVNKTESCWLWTGGIFKGYGYGQFAVKRHPQKAHRVSWVLNCGAIPEDKKVLHTCDNPLCVNPKHLFLGTQLDNARDMVNKGRNRYTSLPLLCGEESPASKLNTKQVQAIRDLYATGEYSQRDLAKIFNVGQTTIGHILRYETWRE